jgi:cell division septum initiation protein DivIVA
MEVGALLGALVDKFRALERENIELKLENARLREQIASNSGTSLHYLHRSSLSISDAMAAFVDKQYQQALDITENLESTNDKVQRIKAACMIQLGFFPVAQRLLQECPQDDFRIKAMQAVLATSLQDSETALESYRIAAGLCFGSEHEQFLSKRIGELEGLPKRRRLHDQARPE